MLFSLNLFWVGAIVRRTQADTPSGDDWPALLHTLSLSLPLSCVPCNLLHAFAIFSIKEKPTA